MLVQLILAAELLNPPRGTLHVPGEDGSSSAARLTHLQIV